MKLTNKRFWIAWLVLLILAIVSCMAGGWSEDTALLGVAYMGCRYYRHGYVTESEREPRLSI